MQEYMYLIRGGDLSELAQSPEKMQQHMQTWMKWMEDLGKKGKFIGGQPLQTTGKIIKGTNKVISDGPYTEGKEIVGGYILVRAKDMEEAIELTKDCPIFPINGLLEIRPIQSMEV